MDIQRIEEMPHIERDGGSMPCLGLGTFQNSGEECRRSVATALDVGYRHVDTARMYENEQSVGAGIKDSSVSREDIFLTSKLAMGSLDRKGVHSSCDKSLQCLDTAYLDLLLIHWPEEDTPLEETLEAMADLKSAGKIRHIGVSNFTVSWLERLLAVSDESIFCNQIEYHPYLDQSAPIGFCDEHGIAVVAYSPLARGKVMKDDRLTTIGAKYGKSAVQVALRWLLGQAGVAAIPKGRSEDHIRENIDIFDFDLNEEDLKEISALEHDQRLIDPDWAPEWDEPR